MDRFEDEFPDGSTRAVGQRAEDLAATKIVAAGLEIVARNVELAGAELDLIARGHDGVAPMVVFVEVRSRGREDLGSPIETVDARKQRQIVRAARAWLVQNDLWERVAVRFDVIGISPGPNAKAPSITWIEGAFEVDG